SHSRLIIGATAPQFTSARILAMSTKNPTPPQMSFVSPGPTASSTWRVASSDRLCLRSACLSGNSGPKNAWHYLLGRTEPHLIEICMSESTQTKSVKRGRGRPRLFDRTAAIEQAMVLFWDRGYEGTTFDHSLP